MQNGYYYAVVKDVSVECYDPPSDAASTSGSKSYIYNSRDGMESNVEITNDNTILGSFMANGAKPDYNPSASADGSQPTQTQETVPGLSGGGAQQQEGQSASSSAANGSPTGGGGSQGFTQGGGTSEASTVVAGSAVALLGFFVAALML